MKSINDRHIWTSQILINIGLDLWIEKKHGHAILLIIGSQLGLRIGDLLDLKWKDLIDFKNGRRLGKLELKKDDFERPLNDHLVGFIETVADSLKVEKDDFVFQNYKTGNQFTTASLNRDLRNITNKIHADFYDDLDGVTVNDSPIVELNKSFLETPIKTKDIELGWARDEVIARGQTHQSFVWMSKFLNHKNTKYTIEQLGLEVMDDAPRFNHQWLHPVVQNFREAIQDELDQREYLIKLNEK